jgi:O-methyltransferase
MSLKHKLVMQMKYALAPLIFRFPPFGLQPERLATYLSGLLSRIDLPGDVAEVGCHLGGTAAIAAPMLKTQGWTGDYICYDTFGGFVDDQFDTDVRLGTPKSHKGMFSSNSERLVRRVLDYHNASHVKLIAGDITKIPEDKFSERYSVVLLDVDLSEPTYRGLQRFWPRIVPGGVIYVDDCPVGYDWKAREGYSRFCRENGIVECYQYGFGVLEKAV